MMATDEAGSEVDPAHKDSDVELSGKPAENLTTLQTISEAKPSDAIAERFDIAHASSLTAALR